MSKTDLDYCINLVKEENYDIFLALMFSPPKDRTTLFGISALYFKVQKIINETEEELLVAIKLKWWEEQTDKIFNSVKAESSPILKLIEENKEFLNKEILEKIINNSGTIEEILAFKTGRHIKAYNIIKAKREKKGEYNKAGMILKLMFLA